MNITLFYLIHNLAFQYPWLDAIIRFSAESLIYIAIVLITFIYAVNQGLLKREYLSLSKFVKQSRNVIFVILTTGATYLLANVLKLLFRTERPFVALSNVQTLISESGFAFPSGHSTTIGAFAFAIYFRNKRLGYLALAAMVLVGLARIASGVHFPIDIIGGFAIGFMVAFFTRTL